MCLDRGVAGVIATNTTLAATGLRTGRPAARRAGRRAVRRPLTARAREVVAFIHRETGGRLPIIGVGGILDPADAVALSTPAPAWCSSTPASSTAGPAWSAPSPGP